MTRCFLLDSFSHYCFFYFKLTAMNFRLHPSCGFSCRFVFRLNLKSANSLRIGPRPKRIYNGLTLSKVVKNNASGDVAQFKAASFLIFVFFAAFHIPLIAVFIF